MGIDFTGRGRLRGRALSDGRFTSMLRTVYHHLGDSWKWAHEASDFAASLFYSSISGVSKWFFPQAPSKLSTQTFKPVHNLGFTFPRSRASSLVLLRIIEANSRQYRFDWRSLIALSRGARGYPAHPSSIQCPLQGRGNAVRIAQDPHRCIRVTHGYRLGVREPVALGNASTCSGHSAIFIGCPKKY